MKAFAEVFLENADKDNETIIYNSVKELKTMLENFVNRKKLYKDLPVCNKCQLYPCERCNKIDHIISQKRNI